MRMGAMGSVSLNCQVHLFYNDSSIPPHYDSPFFSLLLFDFLS